VVVQRLEGPSTGADEDVAGATPAASNALCPGDDDEGVIHARNPRRRSGKGVQRIHGNPVNMAASIWFTFSTAGCPMGSPDGGATRKDHLSGRPQQDEFAGRIGPGARPAH
jgi:hypothetical protein